MSPMKEIYFHKHFVGRRQKEKKNGHRGCVVWLTGLPGSGKSTIANHLELILFKNGLRSIILDGDNVRMGLNSDLGFSKKDRGENIRRVGEVAKLFAENGQIAIVSFVSPFRRDRDSVRKKMRRGDFTEVYASCDLDTCRERDPKGLYKKAGKGKIPYFTGVSSPYERPLAPEVIVDTARQTAEGSSMAIYDYLLKNKYLKAGR